MEYKIVQLKGREFCRWFGWSWRSSRRIFKRRASRDKTEINDLHMKHMMDSFKAQKA